jgi:hypothetical protein
MNLKKAECVYKCWHCDKVNSGRAYPDRISYFTCGRCDCRTKVEVVKEADGIKILVTNLEPKERAYNYTPRPKKAVRKVEAYPSLSEPFELAYKSPVAEIESEMNNNDKELERLKNEIEKMRKRR